uniref:Uncharacterized protein n=1 Tax=Arundo donax TaxID=35708 RepID=A0A0A9DR89_ARUDO
MPGPGRLPRRPLTKCAPRRPTASARRPSATTPRPDSTRTTPATPSAPRSGCRFSSSPSSHLPSLVLQFSFSFFSLAGCWIIGMKVEKEKRKSRNRITTGYSASVLLLYC